MRSSSRDYFKFALLALAAALIAYPVAGIAPLVGVLVALAVLKGFFDRLGY